ncbi:MAG: GFA family protein [Deltaproteobacteria bacterium]|nr:GFA family protein [Deltaproteobacteria bacterium]
MDFQGGCHCGRVRFRVTVAEPLPPALDCNCSVCAMKGFLHLIVEKSAFELLQGAEDLTEYRFGTGAARHLFCRACGIHGFYIPRSHPDGVDVNVRCLDGDARARFSVQPYDGQNWEANIDRIR